jgi:hypothetical protein
MGWMILSAVVAGCTDRGEPANDDSAPVDDSARPDDSGAIPLPSATSWVECNWASVPASPISSLAVGTEGAWFASASQVYTLDVPTHTLIKDLSSPTGTRAMWADAEDNVYTMSTKSIAMRPVGGAWTPLREEKDRTLLGVTGNDLGVWFATSDGSVLRLDDKGQWNEEDVVDGSFLRAIWGRDDELWVATATRVYHRAPDGQWEIEAEIPESDTEVFDEIRGDATAVWAVVAQSAVVLRRDAEGEWNEAGPDAAVGTVHLWSQQSTWYATDGVDTWKLEGGQWSPVTGPERQFAPIAVGSNGVIAYALGGGDAIARSETAGLWDLVIASPWAPVYDAIVVGSNMFAAGEMGLYPNETGLVRYVSDGFWIDELHHATVRALLSPNDTELWAAGTGAIWRMDGEWTWSADLIEPTHDFRGLAVGPEGSMLAVASDGTFFMREHGGTWTPETTGASQLSAVLADGEQIWAVGAGIFRRDPVEGWIDESPSDGAVATFADIEVAYDAEGNKLGVWAVGQADGMPAIYSRGPDADSGWTVEASSPDFSDATSGLIASMYVDAAHSIWLLGERVTKKGDHSFVMHSDSTGWVGEEPGGAGVSRRMIWMANRRWVFGDAIDVRPLTEEGCI